jgi:hypothetical protein
MINKRLALFSPRSEAPGFKNKTRYTPYVSLENEITHMTTNRGNIIRQCLIYDILSLKGITLDTKKRKDNSVLQAKAPTPQGYMTS